MSRHRSRQRYLFSDAWPNFDRSKWPFGYLWFIFNRRHGRARLKMTPLPIRKCLRFIFHQRRRRRKVFRKIHLNPILLRWPFKSLRFDFHQRRQRGCSKSTFLATKKSHAFYHSVTPSEKTSVASSPLPSKKISFPLAHNSAPTCGKRARSSGEARDCSHGDTSTSAAARE